MISAAGSAITAAGFQCPVGSVYKTFFVFKISQVWARVLTVKKKDLSYEVILHREADVLITHVVEVNKIPVKGLAKIRITG